MAYAVPARPSQPHNVLRYVPLLSPPALRPGEYERDTTLIYARTISGVALSCIAMAALYWTCPPIALLVAKYEMASCGAVLLSFVPGMVEFWRAESAADRFAADDYSSSPTPSTLVTDRLCVNPRAVQHLVDRDENLNKVDSDGIGLAYKIFSMFRLSWGRDREVRRMVVDTDIDLFALNSEGKSLLMLIVKDSDSATLRHILKSGKVQARNISERDQAAIWKHVRRAEIFELLCQYRFNVDARDAEGETPLMYWARNERGLPLVVAALNARANPLLQNGRGEKASQLVPLNSLSQSLLLQAEREFMNEPPDLPQERGLMARLPWRPLVCRENLDYEPDGRSISYRISKVSISAFALLWLAPSSLSSIALKIFTGVHLMAIPWFFTEMWRGGKEADRQAVVDHLTRLIPSSQSTATLCHSVAAANLLIEHSPRRELLDKLDEDGVPILGKDGIINPEVFKLLVDKGANIFAGEQQSGFFLAVRQRSPEFLDYLLEERRLVNISNISPELQVKMWCSIGSEPIARSLQRYGFNPDVRDAEGYTALMRLAAQTNTIGGGYPISKIRALLDVRADPNLKNRAGKTARELTEDTRVLNLLTQRR